jgi:catechol 2,3-dioxygenase-like lactoylglutathione lyase family enzyme
VIEGVSKVVVEVNDQSRALEFWTETLGFELHQDTTHADERWVEVRTPDKGLILVLSPRRDDRPSASDRLPTSTVSSAATTWPSRTRSFARAESSSCSRRSS